MKYASNLGRQPPSNRRLNLIGAAVICMTVVAAGLTIWDLRADAIRTSTEQIKNLGVAFAEQTSRTLRAIDLVLDQTKDRVLGSAIRNPERFEQKLSGVKWHRFLADRLKSLPQADALAFISADGKLVNTSRQWPAPDADFSNSDFIEYFRLRDDSASFLGIPVKDPDSDSWTVSIARRISGRGGEFLALWLRQSARTSSKASPEG